METMHAEPSRHDLEAPPCRSSDLARAKTRRLPRFPLATGNVNRAAGMCAPGEGHMDDGSEWKKAER